METWNIPCRRHCFIFMMETSSDSLWKLAQEPHSSASLVCGAQRAPLDLGKEQLSQRHPSLPTPSSLDFLCSWPLHTPHVLRCKYTAYYYNAKQRKLWTLFTGRDSFLWDVSRGGSWNIIWVLSITVLWKLQVPNWSSFALRGLGLNAKLVNEPIQGPSRKCPFPETRFTPVSKVWCDISPRTCNFSYPSWQAMEFTGERSCSKALWISSVLAPGLSRKGWTSTYEDTVFLVMTLFKARERGSIIS